MKCDKVGCGKEIRNGDLLWSIVCEQWARGGYSAFNTRKLRLCHSCYDDVCAFINNEENEVKDE